LIAAQNYVVKIIWEKAGKLCENCREIPEKIREKWNKIKIKI
jgi:hypothetical protein